MKNVIHILVFFFGLSLSTNAQDVRLTLSNGGNSLNHMTALDLFQFGIESTSTKEDNYKIRITLESQEYGRIGQIVTSDFTVRLGFTSGTSIYSNASLSKNENSNNPDFYGFSKLAFTYPAAQYSYCIELLSIENNIEDRICTNVELINALELLLIYPFDEEKLATENPVFSWTPVVTGSNAISYRIKWFESNDKIDQENKIFARRPYHELNYVSSNMLPYDAKYPQFQKDRYYYWQVEAMSGNTLIAKSEIWKFSFEASRRFIPIVNHYVDVNNSQDNAIHRFSGGAIYFKWENRYNTDELEYEIKNADDLILNGTLTGIESGNNYLFIDAPGINANTLLTLTLKDKKHSYDLRMMKL